MKRLLPVTIFLLVLIGFGTSIAFASGYQDPNSDLVAGAQLYDKWYAALGIPASCRAKCPSGAPVYQYASGGGDLALLGVPWLGL